MFNKHEHRGRRSTPLPFVIFRTLLSLTMLTIFSLGVYSAYTHFSGVDPLKMDPKTLVNSYLSSPQSLKLVNSILSSNLPGLSGIQARLRGLVGASQAQNPLTIPSNLDFRVDPSKPLLLKFALVADSHNDNENLKKALIKAKEQKVKFVIGLGDFSDVGTVEELQAAKVVFDSMKLPYYLTPGDHDLWDSRDKGQGSSHNFMEVFGSTYSSFSDSDIRFILLYNADNYDGVDSLQKHWFDSEIDRLKDNPPKAFFLLTHEPFYHPSSDHFMGKADPKLSSQAEAITQEAKEAGVKEVFAGDAHFFTRYTDPKTDLRMTTVGAVTSKRNSQAPRFSIVDVYNDGSYNVEDLEIN